MHIRRFHEFAISLMVLLLVTTTVANAQVRVNNRVNSSITPAANNVPRVESLGRFGGRSLADTDLRQISRPLNFNSSFNAPASINSVTPTLPSFSSGSFGGRLNFGTINTRIPSVGNTPSLTIPPLSIGTLQIPSFSSPSSTLPGTSGITSSLGNLALPTLPPVTTTLPGFTFDEEELLGASPILSPSSNLGFQVDPSLTMQNVEFAKSLGISPLGANNFGLSPWSTTIDLSPPSNLAYQDRDTPDRGIDPSIPTLEESGQTGKIDPLKSGLTRYDEHDRKSVRDNIFNATDALDIDRLTSGQSAWDSNPLVPQPTTPGGPVTATPGGLYGRMKQTVAMIESINTRSTELAKNSDSVPSVRAELDVSRSFLIETNDTPLGSFTSGSLDPSEQFTTSAEKHLRDGNYLRALAHYEVALTADQSNPLNHLGQGIAYIGAGEYYSAVRRIERAIDMFPEIAYFKFDLTRFITDADLLDVRRADLETRLAEHEDYRYRFLLGFIEYHMNLEKFGLKNLENAAANAPADSAIARFPKILKTGNDLRALKPTADTAELP